jgi:hypothetical protein
VPDALVEWRNAGIKTYIYSSGSREAQVCACRQLALQPELMYLLALLNPNIPRWLQQLSC